METAEQLLALLDQFVDAEPIQSLRANGVLVADDDTSLGRLYLCNQVGGYEILSVDGRIVTVFIYVLGQDGRTLFAGHFWRIFHPRLRGMMYAADSVATLRAIQELVRPKNAIRNRSGIDTTAPT